MIEINYIRCINCCNIYDNKLIKCPKCDTIQPVQEDLQDNEPTFNILEG